jgi:hypothetical protein
MIAKPAAAHAPSPAWPGIIAMAAISLGCAAVLFWFDPSQYPIYPQCLFHRLTGWNCPGCGSTRAIHQLLHGHLTAALRCNALLILSLPFVAVFSLRQFMRWRAGLPVVFPKMRPATVAWFIGVLVLFTILRNIPGAPFIYLSPP